MHEPGGDVVHGDAVVSETEGEKSAGARAVKVDNFWPMSAMCRASGKAHLDPQFFEFSFLHSLPMPVP